MRKLTLIAIVALSLMAFGAAYAGPGCGAAKADAQKTGAGCAYSSTKTAALQGLEIETTRMPSGAMLVFYSSDNAETVKTLHASAATGSEGFDCRLCQKIAGDAECTIELALVENGIVALVMAEDAATVDAYEKQYAALTAVTPGQ